jgi:mono/diheme cytochrome c family protein
MMGLSLAVALLALVPLAPGGPQAKRPADGKKGPEDTQEIPDAARDRRNPVFRSEETLRLARTLWRTNCETCHGVAGRGDGPNARLHERRKGHAPRNLTDPNVQENLTDGEIFWRVSKGIIEEGNIIMPAFEKEVPSETQRWLLVLFVRELGKAARP